MMNKLRVRLFFFLIISFPLFGTAQDCDRKEKNTFGTAYDSVICEVLKSFPEIDTTRLLFVEKDLKTTMATRPHLDFLFRKRENRVYKVFIDTLVLDSNGLLLQDVPEQALVGILAHEFGHIVDYRALKNCGVVRLGLRYVFSLKARAEIENRVDSITMEYGFMEESIAFADFVMSSSQVSEEYKQYKARVYNSPGDLRKMAARIKERKKRRTSPTTDCHH